MLAMYSNLSFDNWAELLPFVQLAHNTAYSTTLQETPHFVMFGRAAVLPVDPVLGVRSTSAPQSQFDYSKQTVKNLQLAYELARRNLKERADKQAVANETLSFPSFKPGEQVLIHRPYSYTEADGPNPKLISPWRGPYTVRAQTSPVIYHVTKDGNTAEITVQFGRMKKYFVPLSSPAPNLDALDDLFLGTALPVPDLEGSLSKVMIGAFTVESIDGHKRGVGAASLANFQYHHKLEGYPTQMGIWRHVNAIPQCREDMIASYRAAVLSTDSSPFNPPTRKSHSFKADVS